VARYGPFGNIEDRVCAFGHEIAFLECEAEPPVDSSMPLKIPFRDVAETHGPKAANELVPTQTAAVHDHRSWRDEHVPLLLPLPEHALTEDLDQKGAA
jgi:hypothetical protein